MTEDEISRILPTHTCRLHPGLRFREKHCAERKRLAKQGFGRKNWIFELTDMWLCEKCEGPIPLEDAHDSRTEEGNQVQQVRQAVDVDRVLSQPTGNLRGLLKVARSGATPHKPKDMDPNRRRKPYRLDVMEIYKQQGAFGMLHPVCQAGKSKFGSILWLCRCECGNEVTVIGSNLTKGNTQSCGCNKFGRKTKAAWRT